MEPLFCRCVGVLSSGVLEYEGGAAEYPGGPPIGVEGRSAGFVVFCVGMRLRNWRVDAVKASIVIYSALKAEFPYSGFLENSYLRSDRPKAPACEI